MTATDIHPAIYSGYGLIEAPIDHVLATFGTHRRAGASTMSVIDDRASVSEALGYLDVRTTPATRLVLLDLDAWTGVLTNDRGGSD